ncbi:MAG: ferrous iron transport protein A [Acidaminococcaceae bacterium]|jgi:ferrous iron transport protein A|nr:ferrous iron transport protein A [Acidaminococcaceae bacterium]
MKTLHDAKIGEPVVVAKVLATGALKRRIVDMGLTKGTRVTVIRVAPLGDPVEISLRNYNLSIRKADAKNILVDG